MMDLGGVAVHVEQPDGGKSVGPVMTMTVLMVAR